MMRHAFNFKKLDKVNGLLQLRRGLTVGHNFIRIPYNRTCYENKYLSRMGRH